MPVAAVSLTQEEWDELGKHGMSQIPRDRLLISSGAMCWSPCRPKTGRAG